MTEHIIEGVSPTRMDLLDIRKKLILAEKGHKLLEEKRDALVEKFFGIIHKRNEILKKIDVDFSNAIISLIESQMILGEKKVDEISYTTPDIGVIDIVNDNIMGVKIPKINQEQLEQDLKISYSLIETCSKLDDTQQEFKLLLKELVDLADLEGSIKSLTIEIEKTKRRVNVLENNLIPKLISTIKYIEMQLEEREREDFFRRKRIKTLIEIKKSST